MYIFKLSQDFLQSRNSSSSMKTMVSCLGQPNSDVWVFGPEVQMDLTGSIIPPEELKFFGRSAFHSCSVIVYILQFEYYNHEL